MNNFEDLLDELKEENLLEKNVVEPNKGATESEPGKDESGVETLADQKEENKDSGSETPSEKISADAPEKFEKVQNQAPKQKPRAGKVVSQTEFFRNRAVSEVGGLQTVEHVFSGVERQQKKIAPEPYDDLKVKKALHAFLQISKDVKSPEHAAAEFELMQETENWYSALSHRDKQISITHLRRYCETAKPTLSNEALLALARFYRNSPYSEAARSKFDLIVTRLFSKDLPDEKRERTFERDELIEHLAGLYAEWESISLYSGEEDESEIVLTAFKFEDFMNEAEKAESFDALIRNDFFNRLRAFKQSTGEQFFAPLVTAAAVESNIRIGNRYLQLLERERDGGEVEKLENKYGFLHDQVISDATSKTLQLVELLKIKAVAPPIKIAPKQSVGKETAQVKKEPEKRTIENPPVENSSATKKANSRSFAVNKWLLTAAIVAVISSLSLYVWSQYYVAADKPAQDVKKVNIDNSSLKEYIKEARIGNNTFFAVVLPSWNTLSGEKKEDVLKKIVSIGGDKGFENVHLISGEGKSVGTAAPGIIEVKN
ncbi:MAG TPA: hypothetical protein VNI84_14195 [Pyrinomonadaceae bacterium]|nr:hypothetical protein [Pyrinomonadaceae bacterium]